MKDGSKSDRIDARKLAELLRGNQLTSVYHGEHGMRTIKELGRSYLTITKDLTRVMNRIKALYRSWAIPCSGTSVYAPRHRAVMVRQSIPNPEFVSRAERLCQQLDLLQPVRQQAATRLADREPQASCREIASPDSFDRSDLCSLADLRKLQTPHRFRSKRLLWA